MVPAEGPAHGCFHIPVRFPYHVWVILMANRIPGENLTVLTASLANAIAAGLNVKSLTVLASFLGTLSNDLFLIVAQRNADARFVDRER